MQPSIVFTNIIGSILPKEAFTSTSDGSSGLKVKIQGAPPCRCGNKFSANKLLFLPYSNLNIHNAGKAQAGKLIAEIEMQSLLYPFFLFSDNKQLPELHPEIVKNTSQTILQCPYKKNPQI